MLLLLPFLRAHGPQMFCDNCKIMVNLFASPLLPFVGPFPQWPPHPFAPKAAPARSLQGGFHLTTQDLCQASVQRAAYYSPPYGKSTLEVSLGGFTQQTDQLSGLHSAADCRERKRSLKLG